MPEFWATLLRGMGLELRPALAIVETYVRHRRLRVIGTAKQGLSVEAAYTVVLRDDRAADDFITTINRLDGVQSVELRRPESPEE